MATEKTTTVKKRVRKVVPTTKEIRRDAEGKVIIPVAVRNKMDDILALKAEEAEIKAKLAELNSEVLIFVDSTGDTTVDYNNSKFTKVQSTSQSMDEDELKNNVGTAIFNTISVRAVDKKLLDVAVQKGKVTLDDIAKVTTIKKNKPYLKVTKS